MMQPKNIKTQQKVNLIEERLKAIEGLLNQGYERH